VEDLNVLLVCNHMVMEPVKSFNVLSKCDCFWDFSKTKNLVIVIPVEIDQQNAKNGKKFYNHNPYLL